MRDPRRIKKVLKTIEDIWRQNPDLRLGQLLGNAVPESMIYYIEDETLLDRLCLTYGVDVAKTEEVGSIVEELDEIESMGADKK